MSNLFVVSAGHLLTPDLSRCGVAGVMRAELMALAAELGIEVETGAIDDGQLAMADEVFVSNSVIRIWPVLGVAGLRFRRGPVTMRLADALAARLAGRP